MYRYARAHTCTHTHLDNRPQGQKGALGKVAGSSDMQIWVKVAQESPERSREGTTALEEVRVGSAQSPQWARLLRFSPGILSQLHSLKDSVFPTMPTRQSAWLLLWMKPQIPPTQFSCVQVPYSEATEAHDTESLAWGHLPLGVSMEIAHQVSRALNPDHEMWFSLPHPTEAEST